jgi:hypothetical protein
LKIFSLFKEVHNGRCVEYKNSFLVKSGWETLVYMGKRW